MTALYTRDGSRYARATDDQVIRAVTSCPTLRRKVGAAMVEQAEAMAAKGHEADEPVAVLVRAMLLIVSAAEYVSGSVRGAKP